VRQLRARAPVDARVVITTAAGEAAQVDYGDGPMVRHPETGKYRRTRLFVLTLGCSRKAVRLLAWHSSAQGWAELRAPRHRDSVIPPHRDHLFHAIVITGGPSVCDSERRVHGFQPITRPPSRPPTPTAARAGGLRHSSSSPRYDETALRPTEIPEGPPFQAQDLSNLLHRHTFRRHSLPVSPNGTKERIVEPGPTSRTVITDPWNE